MAAVLETSPPLRHAAQDLWAAWRSLRPQELLWFVLLGVVYGLTDLSLLLELGVDAPWLRVAARLLGLPVLVSLLLIPFWLPVARSRLEFPRRLWALAAAVVAGSALAMALAWPLVRWLEWPSPGELARVAKGRPMFASFHWGIYAGDVLAVMVPALLACLLFDLIRRRQRSLLALQQLRIEHSRLAREAMTSRLAALQAQLEPQFLFDTLVDIEQAYARGDARAPERIERLIHHLRVALPRLREGGTTLQAEIELLRSWLAVAQERWPAPLVLQADWPPALGAATLPPMLVLPLLQGAVQRALQRDGRPPANAWLDARDLDGGGLRLELQLDRPDLCPPPELLRQLGERARALCGGPVRLDCRTMAARTHFTLEVLS